MKSTRLAPSIAILALLVVAATLVVGAGPVSQTLLSPRDLQQTSDPAGNSPRVGEIVWIEGVVTAASPHGDFFFVSDPSGGPWSGVRVMGPSLERTQGEAVRVVGEVRESFGETQLRARRVEAFGFAPLPPVADITVADLTGDGERWEGTLVRVSNVTADGEVDRYNEWPFHDASGYGGEIYHPFHTSYIPDPGDTFASISGPLGFSWGDFHIEPRNDDDLVGWNSIRAFDGVVHVSAVDETGRAMPAKIRFRPLVGELELGPDDRAEGSQDVAYFPPEGAQVPVPSGTYDVVVSRGIEFGLYEQRIEVPSGGVAFVSAILPREVDTSGWISGDFHLHCAPSSDTPLPVPGRVLSLAAEGVEWAISTDHNVITDYSPTIAAMGLEEWVTSSIGDEISTRNPSFGHFNSWPLPSGSAPRPYDGMDPATLFAGARATSESEVVQVNHPSIPEWGNQYFDTYQVSPYTGEPAQPGWSWDFDAIELFNGRHIDQGVTSLRTWMRFLNNGHFPTATGNSDSHHLVWAEPGYPRNFVATSNDSPATVSEGELVEAVRRGATFLSYGPILDFRANGAGLGELVGVDADGRVTFEMRVQCASWLAAGEGVIWANGKPLVDFNLAVDVPGPQDIRRRFVDRPEVDTWYLFQVEGDGDLEPVRRGSDFRPFAITNPIRVDVDGDGKFTPPGNVADLVLVEEVDRVDANGRVRGVGRWVSFEATATTNTGLLDPSAGIFYLDDETGGVQVREQAGTVTPVLRGDLVWVGGFIGQISGETVLVDAIVENRGVGGGTGPVRDLATGTVDFSDEPWEGRVVRIVGANVVGGSWPAGSSGGAVTVDDGSGPVFLIIPAGMTIPAEANDLSDFTFTALLTQRDFSSPYTSSYRLTLRSADDLFPEAPRTTGAPLSGRRFGAVRPNPFTVELRIPYTGQDTAFRIDVIDVAGRRVRTLDVPAGGPGTVVWDGRDNGGRNVANGVYWVRLPDPTRRAVRVVKVR